MGLMHWVRRPIRSQHGEESEVCLEMTTTLLNRRACMALIGDAAVEAGCIVWTWPASMASILHLSSRASNHSMIWVEFRR